MLDRLQHNVRAAAILTTSYVAGTVIEAHLRNQLTILVDFTIGSLDSGHVKVEYSENNSDFYQEAFSSISAGVSTESLAEHKLVTSGSFALYVPVQARYVRISAKGTGTVTGSSMTIKALVGVTA